MKTLKKTLCLVLAMVMVFGMLAISSSAKLSYDDTTAITYKEAVDVMSGIGILEGYPDGSFKPAQKVTRAEAAKMIAYLMIGGADEADALVATKAPFDDVAQGHWAAGYIQYAVNAGVINGVGDNKFNPNEEVTGLQFAKMLLCVIGYGVNDEYTGENWAINVAKDALQYGIFKENLGGANNNAATREECALYAFNTLYLNKVTYSALLGGYIEAWATTNETNKTNTLAKDFWIEVKHQEKDDAFMRYDGGWYWVQYKRNAKGPGEKEVKISEVYGNDYLVGTFTTPVSIYDIYALTGKGTADVYVDGVGVYSGKNPISNLYDTVKIDRNLKGNIPGTGYGVQTYVYKIDNQIRICCINVWLARVEGVLKETDYNYAKTKLTVAYEKGENKNWTYDTAEYEKGSYVVLSYSKKLNAYGEKIGIVDEFVRQAKTVDAKLTQMTNVNGEYKRATAGGVDYIQALQDYVVEGTRASNMTSNLVNGSTYTFYLSDNNIAGKEDEVYLKGISTVNNADATKFVYVAQFGQKMVNTDLNSYYNLTADVYYTDGTHEILLIDSFDVWEELISEADKLNELDRVLNDSISLEDLKNLLNNYGWTSQFEQDFQIEAIKEEIKQLEIGLRELASYFEQYANGFVTTLNNAYIEALNKGANPITGAKTGYTGLYVLSKGVTADYKITPVQSYALTSAATDDAVGAPTEKAPSKVYNRISALAPSNYAEVETTWGKHKVPVYSDASTYFYYVSGTYGTKNFSVTVYQGTNAAPTTTGVNQGLTSYYAAKNNSDGRYYADVALVRGQFKDAVADGKTVYYYDGKSYMKDNGDGTYTVTYQLYKAGEKVDEISYTFNSYKEAQEQLAWDNQLTNHWVVDGWFTQDNDNYYSGLKEALKANANGIYEATKIGDLYYTPYMVVTSIVGDTLYANYLSFFDNYYNGYAVTEDTKVVAIHTVTYAGPWAEEIGGTVVDSLETIKEYAALGNNLVITFSYDENHVVDTIYIVDDLSKVPFDYEGKTTVAP